MPGLSSERVRNYLSGMRPRFRLLAALLALLSLSLTMAEGVWASTCMPGMECDTARASLPVTGAHAPGIEMPMQMGPVRGSGGRRDSRSPETPHCPVAPTPGVCVALAVSIPAHAPESFVPSPEGALAVASPPEARHILVISAFFRPPRA